jgi:hypothetical protein
MTPEPKGKLDTMATQTTGGAQATMAVVAVVNGPEDELLDWHAVDWPAVEEDVRRLRQRIFTGLLEPDARKACKSGSEGGRAQQCARPTRHYRISIAFQAVTTWALHRLPRCHVAAARCPVTGTMTGRF